MAPNFKTLQPPLITRDIDHTIIFRIPPQVYQGVVANGILASLFTDSTIVGLAWRFRIHSVRNFWICMVWAFPMRQSEHGTMDWYQFGGASSVGLQTKDDASTSSCVIIRIVNFFGVHFIWGDYEEVTLLDAQYSCTTFKSLPLATSWSSLAEISSHTAKSNA